MLDLLLTVILKEITNPGALEVVEWDGPHQPIEMLPKLQELSGDDKTIEWLSAHAHELSIHVYLFLDPVSILQVQNGDH